MQAVEKLKAEMEQNKTDWYVQVVSAFLLQHLEANPGDAEKVLAEGKTVKGSLSFMRDEAKKKQSGNMAMFTPQEGFDIVLKYFGITGAQGRFTPAAAPVKPAAPKVDFDVSADVVLVDWRPMDRTYGVLPLRVGTIMEVCYAYQWGKRIISFGNLRRGYWMRHHVREHYDTLEEAIECLKGVERDE